MNIASLFLHNAVNERDRVEYIGVWSDEQKAPIEAAFDVLIDDTDHTWRYGTPRALKRVDGGYNHFQIIKESYGDDFAFKRFTWDSFKYFNTIDEIVEYIDYLHRPLSARG